MLSRELLPFASFFLFQEKADFCAAVYSESARLRADFSAAPLHRPHFSWTALPHISHGRTTRMRPHSCNLPLVSVAKMGTVPHCPALESNAAKRGITLSGKSYAPSSGSEDKKIFLLHFLSGFVCLFVWDGETKPRQGVGDSVTNGLASVEG